MQSRQIFLSAVMAVIGILVAPISMAANDSQAVWSCNGPYSDENAVLWLVEAGENSFVKVFDEVIPAQYMMQGLEKRWDWGWSDQRHAFRYSVLLEPNLMATYFDFGLSSDGKASGSASYQCSKD